MRRVFLARRLDGRADPASFLQIRMLGVGCNDGLFPILVATAEEPVTVETEYRAPSFDAEILNRAVDS